MGLLSNLFGEDKKTALIRELITRRVENDPLAVQFGQNGKSVAKWQAAELYGFPEATVVAIVEAYFAGKRKGLADDQVIAAIEQHRAQFSGPSRSLEQYVSDSLYGVNLETFILRRLAVDHPDGRPLTTEQVKYAITRATALLS